MGTIMHDGILYAGGASGVEIDDTATASDSVWSSSKVSNELSGKVNTSALGVVNGVATLGSDGKITSSQLPTIPTVSLSRKIGTDTVLGGQYLTINGVESIIDGTGYMQKTQNLSTTTDSTYTFSNAAITADSVIDVFTSIFNVVPKDIQLSNGQCKVIFDPYTSAASMTCKIFVG